MQVLYCVFDSGNFVVCLLFERCERRFNFGTEGLYVRSEWGGSRLVYGLTFKRWLRLWCIGWGGWGGSGGLGFEQGIFSGKTLIFEFGVEELRTKVLYFFKHVLHLNVPGWRWLG